MNSKNYNSKKKQEKVSVKEPISLYTTKRIHFFDSMEEENENTYKLRAGYSPIENLQHAVLFIKNIFTGKLKKKSNKAIRLYID